MTGLIYMAIIAVWAVVLVPAWLRRHDHLDPERSVTRFARSMQTLADRPSVLGIPMPTYEAPAVEELPAEVTRSRRPRLSRKPRVDAVGSGQVALTAPSASSAPAEADRQPRRIPTRASRRRAAARRRLVLALLLVITAVIGGLAAAGIVDAVLLAAPASVILLFLLIARHQVRVARRNRNRRRAVATARARVADPVQAPVARAAEATWEPRTAPLPTYVTAPAAASQPGDGRLPGGAWTAAAMLERAQQEKDRVERMAAAKAEAIARAKAEAEAASVEPESRDDEYLTAQSARHDTIPLRLLRAANG